MIEAIPSAIDLSQDYLATYWARELGVSGGRLAQAVGVVGNDAGTLRKYLNDGHRLAIRDAGGRRPAGRQDHAAK